MQRLTKDEFVKKARLKHGTKYDYSRALYKGNKVKLPITCPIHGRFQQTPDAHLQGKGCRACGHIRTGTSKRDTPKVFINKARLKHGNTYDYTLSVYKGTQVPLTIICKSHGPFDQVARDHLSGRGCPKCGRIRIIAFWSMGRKAFLTEARRIHGDKYDYPPFVYSNGRVKVPIICKLHGRFQQAPAVHLRGSGCRKCGFINIAYSRRESYDAASVKHFYLVSMVDTDGTKFCKLGYMAKTLKIRFGGSMYRDRDVKLLVSFTLRSEDVLDLEAEIKRLFVEARYTPKARFDGDTECFDWSVRNIMRRFAARAAIDLWPPRLRKRPEFQQLLKRWGHVRSFYT